MFGTLGGPELFLILVIALIVFGPKKLPEIGKNMGRMIGEFRRASQDFQRTIEDEVAAVNREVQVTPSESSTPKPLLPAETSPVVSAPEAPTVSHEPIEPK